MGHNCIDNELDFQEYIETIINREESYDLEFKKASGGFPKSFWENLRMLLPTRKEV